MKTHLPMKNIRNCLKNLFQGGKTLSSLNYQITLWYFTESAFTEQQLKTEKSQRNFCQIGPVYGMWSGIYAGQDHIWKMQVKVV